uniref:Nuclear receptor domain-containing protein n=1 Tax=Panagrolaimus sp. JU765 TaxID=591449 RepID=A0AC34Q2E3_9BILA
MAEKGLCTICEAPTHGLHFGVSTCKACASFFRRSMVERKRYKCRFQGNCVITNKARNQCRACRLQKCYNNGMVREPSPIPTEPSSHGSVITTSPSTTVLSPPTSVAFSPQQSTSSLLPHISSPHLPSIDISYPRINVLLKAFKSFQDSLKALYKVENPREAFPPIEFQQADKQLHDRLETSAASLIMSMVNEYFPEYLKLDDESRIKIFRPFAVRFSIIYRIYISSQYFPREGDTRICTHYGYYNSWETLHLFFGDIPQIEDIKTLAVPVFTRVNLIKRKAVKIGLREIDVAAIIGLLFSNEIEDLKGLNEDQQRYKADIQAEIFQNILTTYGFEHGGIRLAEVLGLLVDVNNLCVISTESMILGDLVLPKNKHLHSYLYADTTKS